MPVLFVLLVACGSPGVDDEPLRIHFVSGSAEYESEASLHQLQRVLSEDYDHISVTASWGEDSGDRLPGIEALAEADLLIVFTRRMVLPVEELGYIRAHFAAERPVIGIRTASHAFQGYLEMDSEIFGGSYAGHGDDEPTDITLAAGAARHPILPDVVPWSRADKIYRNPELGPRAEALLYANGRTSGLHEPVAWTNRYGDSGRAFYTSMGFPADFENENFRNLLMNAIEWTTGRDLKRKER